MSTPTPVPAPPLPPPPAHTLATWSGQFRNGAAVLEQWSFSLKLSSTPVALDTAGYAAAAASLHSSYTTSLYSVMGDSVVLTKTTVAEVGSDGLWQKNADGSFQKGEKIQDAAGTVVGGMYHPLQTALCVTLTTARAGASGRGRFFLPHRQMALGVDGLLSVAAADLMADTCKTFVNSVNAIASLGQVVVASGRGFLTPVTGLRVGRVADTMRSRRKDQIEDYRLRFLP